MIGALRVGRYVAGWIGVDPMRETLLIAMLAMGIGVSLLSAIWLWFRPLPRQAVQPKGGATLDNVMFHSKQGGYGS